MRTKRFFFTFVFFLAMHCQAQQSQVSTLLSADSLASGNVKDVLTSFYQLALHNLVGPKKEFNFTSNPYALMLKTNPNLSVDSSYRRYRVLRKLNFGVGVALDESYKFSGFSSGIKYALINNRDSTTSRWLLESALQADNEYTELNQALGQYARNSLRGDSLRDFILKVDTLFNNKTKTFDQFDPGFVQIVKMVAQQQNLKQFLAVVSGPKVNIYAKEHESFDALKHSLQNKFLWTIGISDTSYKDQLLFSNLLFSTEALKGILHSSAATNLELDIKASYNLINDSLLPGKNLRKGIFAFEPGVNWVFKNKNTQLSFLEIKFSGEYDHVFTGLYPNEKQDRIDFNGTLRLRISNNIWIPLQFRYDPVAGNVLGFINVTTNFTGMGK